MKKIVFTLFTFLIVTATIAQVPSLVNYQAVARDSAGQPMAGKTIQVRFTITQNEIIKFQETREVLTNTQGLFQVQIGSGGASAVTGSLNNINWLNIADHTYLLKVESNLGHNGQFMPMAVQQLASVPFSFASQQSHQTINAQRTIYADTVATANFAHNASVATETALINGKPLDTLKPLAAGDKLKFGLGRWTVRPKDTLVTLNGEGNLPNGANGWVFIGPTAVVTLTKSGTITCNIAASAIAPGTVSGQLNKNITADICYELLSFVGPGVDQLHQNGEPLVTMNFDSRQFSFLATRQLPAGTYRVGMGVKSNPSTDVRLKVNGIIKVKY